MDRRKNTKFENNPETYNMGKYWISKQDKIDLHSRKILNNPFAYILNIKYKKIPITWVIVERKVCHHLRQLKLLPRTRSKLTFAVTQCSQ